MKVTKPKFWASKDSVETLEASAEPTNNAIATTLATLLVAIQRMIQPGEIWRIPYLDDGAMATNAAASAGRIDANSDPFDSMSRAPGLPNQMTVLQNVKEILELPGQRAYAVLAALRAGTLSPPFVASVPVKGWHAASWRTRILMLVTFILEVVFGSKMAERLAGVGDYWAWAVGVGIAAVLTGSALSVAHLIHTRQVGFLRSMGAWVALAVSIAAVIFLGLYAWGLGGGAQASTDGGGLEGGSVAAPATTEPDPQNWGLTLIYGALLVLLLCVVVSSHLIDLYHEEIERVDRDMASKKSVLQPAQQVLLAIEILTQCLMLVDQGRHRARGLVQAYVGGALQVLPPELISAWDTSVLENEPLPDPAWAAEIKLELERLRRVFDPADHDGPTPPPLTLARTS